MSAPASVLTYRDLESEMHEAVDMSEIACSMMENAQGPSNRRDGCYRLTDDEMRLISFAVYHSNRLVRDLKKKWDAIHDSNVSAHSQKGGAK